MIEGEKGKKKKFFSWFGVLGVKENIIFFSFEKEKKNYDLYN